MELEKWFKLKKYPHIGLPITLKDYQWVQEYTNDPEKIRVHSFTPFLHKVLINRKFRAIEGGDRKKGGKRKRAKSDPKVRHVYYSSHIDSLIFSKYNSDLLNAYEKLIENEPFNKSVVAYRKLSLDDNPKKYKCNIDFAKTTFEFIESRKDRKLSVVVADVTSFFDNLDHKILKRQWANTLLSKTLPSDHYNLFKALTRLRFIEEDQLFDSLDGFVLLKKGIPNSNKTTIKKKRLKSRKYFKENNVVAYCYKDEFIKKHLSLVKSEVTGKGIPQGSAISATLANIYMLDFDREVFDYVSSIGGYYQRYSDDMIVICNREDEDDIINLIREKIDSLVKLKIEPKKTKVYRFEEISGEFLGFEINEKTKVENFNKTLEYLGFSYDGQKVRIKTSGFSKFYRSMKSSFRRAAAFAKFGKNPDRGIFKSRLYKRFTFLGATRKLIYRPSKDDPKKYLPTKEYYWGNYMSYIYKANGSMRSINKDDSIAQQSRRFWYQFHELMKHHEKSVADYFEKRETIRR